MNPNHSAWFARLTFQDSRRDLSDVALEYLFVDGSHFRYHDGARAEPVLAAWGHDH